MAGTQSPRRIRRNIHCAVRTEDDVPGCKDRYDVSPTGSLERLKEHRLGKSRTADHHVADERHVTHCGSSESHLYSSGLFCFAVSYFHIFHTGENALSCVIHYVMPPPDALHSVIKECLYQLCLECILLDTQANVRDAEWADLASIIFLQFQIN
jgi:hypothetical protein